ncbi:hypothetical protein DYH10_02275 [Candidatus Saccharibacteria bacterium CPR2]|nr:hypothetical protein [Candidatus Saccharibacteria bacterium CPR2]
MTLELVAIAFGGLLILGLITYASRKRSKLDRAYFKKRWQKICDTYKVEETGPTIAVIEADKLFDQALKNAGYAGETTGDRLKSAGKSLRSINTVWDAHKLRNKLVHETEIKLKKNDAKNALKSFYRALREIGAL